MKPGLYLETYTFSDLEKPCSSISSLSEAALSKLSDNMIFLSSSGHPAELVSVHALRDSAHSDLENTVELPAHVGTVYQSHAVYQLPTSRRHRR